ncbi:MULTISPECIES: GntR family transcriptional regulator [Roseateles]|uniref:GntR family transcriptional regulator n=1 Tax=Pelomonas aquatica TaxID=431058 RepID=A0ABU1ZI06_9BURK|nr:MULTISPECIES: GntR family transcriptional regulator [Roseateles]KQY79800.1 GntR family transcriptional regulator [Pelomonas sp. Root1444]MDR7299686.1 GntR family transcriptional regulator [Pelomonas aquatica]
MSAVFDFKPDPNAASPLYMQLAQGLAQAIRDGIFHADEALPSERVLAEQLALSRVTARKAIDRLVEQGLIIRKRGSGNYIAPKLEQPLTRLTSFSEELHQRGFVPSSRWLQRGFTPAAPDEQLSLELKSGERVARLERLRLADAVVMAYEVSVLPQSVLPDPQKVEASLYTHLGDRAPVRALQHIRALNADAKLAGLLEVPLGAAVLFITRVGYLASGKAVELTHSYCRSDYYDFVAEMRRD